MSGTAAVRGVVGGLGVLLGLYGAWLLWDRQTPDQVVTVGTWLAVGVVLHDVGLAAALLLLGWVVVRLVPAPAKAPLTVGAVVLGSVTLLAVPVLLSYGRKSDNPTLLDRDYGAGWLVLAGLVVVAVLVATVLRARAGDDQDGRSARTQEDGTDGTGAGGRRRPDGA